MASVSTEEFLATQGGITPLEFAVRGADALGLQRPTAVKVKEGASVWRLLDACLFALMKANGNGYVEGAMSRQTGVCCQSFAKATMQCFMCPYRSAEMPTLRRFYQEAKEKALALYDY